MYTVTRQGAVDVIRGSTPLDQEHVEQLHSAVERCFEDGQPAIVMDMSEVQLVDSSGLEALLETRDHVEVCGGTIKLAAITPLVDDILRATGLYDKFDCFPNVKSAVGSFLR